MSVERVSNDLIGQSSYMLSTKFSSVKITERQSEVLFYTIRGKTVKQIARFLSLSPRTIDEYLEQLRNKFDSSNKHELIDKAICSGFLNVIPETLLKTQLSIELKD